MDRPRRRLQLPSISSWSASSLDHAPSFRRQTSQLGVGDDIKGPIGLTRLHSPPSTVEVVAELVFVHGLGGGSRKTWSFSPATDSFWPQAWLPGEPGLEQVRIHSFGYNADWTSRQKSILRIHDFAQSLAGALKNDPDVRAARSRIILIGHSMGGCVAKQAYILTRQNETYKALDGRITSMFFLGTPHRGSDMATLLENVLMAGWGKKPFVQDLTPHSTTLSLINDIFPQYAADLRIWSFYETLPMRAGLMNRMIVERHSATLNFPGEERTAMMNADHRQVCKFESRDEPNYKILKNALVTAVEALKVQHEIVKEAPTGTIRTEFHSTATHQSAFEARINFQQFLGPIDTTESSLLTLQGLKEPGSCGWFSQGLPFSCWKAGRGPGILWLMGRPASGKSVISGHVVEQLKSANMICSYFFFRHSAAGKSELSECFRSIAYQMAQQDEMVHEKLYKVESEGITWDKDDDLSVWGRLFVGGIFKLSTMSQHYWVIDGLDECATPTALFTKRILASLPLTIRLFATSRDMDAMNRGLASLGKQVELCRLSEADTLADMRSFVRSRLDELGRLETEEHLAHMCQRILDKSSGSFLWIRLVLQEFENAWTDEMMEDILEEIPADLYDLYSRMLQSIEADGRRLPLARSLLTWVALAARPMTLDELRCAIQMDTGQTLQSMAKAVPTLCGHLVYVDGDGKVHMIHHTAREFVLRADLHSSLAAPEGGNSRLASLLLYKLSGNVFRAQQSRSQPANRTRRFSRATNPTQTSEWALLDYACHFVSEHVHRSTSEDNTLAGNISDFLRSNNVLFLIEHLAKGKNLGGIIKTAGNLRHYLGRRMKHVPPTDPNLELLDGWTTDMIRIATRFRAQLLACPSSIYCLIPPLCPSASITSRSIISNPRSSALLVKGLKTTAWDDCLSRITFHEGRTAAVRAGCQIFAVGLITGKIILYDTDSIEIITRLEHPERLSGLEISPDDRLLASYGIKRTCVWDLTSKTMVHDFCVRSPLSIIFLDADELLCMTQASKLIKWNLDNGESVSLSWKEDHDQGQSCADSEFPPGTVPNQMPTRAAFLDTGEEVLLAIGYRVHPVVLWNAMELQPLGLCHTEDPNNGIDAMTFNPNLAIPVLVVAYNDGRLCIHNYMTMECTQVLPQAYTQSISCSRDGRRIVTGGSRGLLEVFEFNEVDQDQFELVPVYRIKTGDNAIQSVAFSLDTLRFMDISGRHCRLWAPIALVRMDDELESTSDALGMPSIPMTLMASENSQAITSNLVPTSDGKYIVAGNNAGEIILFSTASAERLSVLFTHGRGVLVTQIALASDYRLITSADDGGRVLVAELPESLSDGDTVAAPDKSISASCSVVLDLNFGESVRQLLISKKSDRLLVSGRQSTRLWNLPGGEELPSLTASLESSFDQSLALGEASSMTDRNKRFCFQHPIKDENLVVLNHDEARIFSWNDFSEVSSLGPTVLQAPRLGAASQASSTFHVGPEIVVEMYRESQAGVPHLYAWPVGALEPSPVSGVYPATETNLEAIAPGVREILGFVGSSTMVFLDTNLWVCSTELQSPSSPAGSGKIQFQRRISAPSKTVHARRHFFALSEWLNGSDKLVHTLAVTPGRSGGCDIVFANGPGIVVVRSGLEFSQEIAAAELGSPKRQLRRVGTGLRSSKGGPTGGHHLWETVSGSMHRRTSIR